MKAEIPPPVVAGVAIVVLVVAVGFGWAKLGDNGEKPNPKAGHPDKALMQKLQVSRGNETEEQYANVLRASRPDLTDAEVQAKADNWWRLRSGQGEGASAVGQNAMGFTNRPRPSNP